MPHFEMNLNIWYYLPDHLLAKLPLIYEQMDGWIGNNEEYNFPQWYGPMDVQEYINASIEPSGLHFEANLPEEKWLIWQQKFKHIATEVLGFEVGEPEDGFE